MGDGVWAFMRPTGGWGGETNTGLVVSPGAASLVVDTVWDVAWAKRIADVQRPLVADAPVTEAVNTHSDGGDHWWGQRHTAGDSANHHQRSISGRNARGSATGRPDRDGDRG